MGQTKTRSFRTYNYVTIEDYNYDLARLQDRRLGNQHKNEAWAKIYKRDISMTGVNVRIEHMNRDL